MAARRCEIPLRVLKYFQHQWNTKPILKQFYPAKSAILLCSHSNGDIFTCENNMLFSRVKRSCFRAKAHLVFHWCLYNNVNYYTLYSHCLYSNWPRLRATGLNIVGQQLPTLLDITCCVRLHTLLHVIGCCCVLLRKVWNRSNFSINNYQHLFCSVIAEA